MTLNELPIGKKAVITQVNGQGPLRLRMLDMGIIPNTPIEIRKIAPMGDPIEIYIRGYELTIRLEEAESIQVKVEDLP